MKINDIKEDGRVVKGVNTTVDVAPGETKRQAAKFGNKVNSKNEPPLLNKKAKDNASPHVLSNIGLAESVESPVYGYKIMAYNPETGEVSSGADNRVTAGMKIKKGMVMKMPLPGIFMSTNREFVETNYGGHNDHEVLIKFEFDPSKITTGNITDRENDFTVPAAKVIGVKVINNLEESTQLNELFDKKYNWNWVLQGQNALQADFEVADGGNISVFFVAASNKSPVFEVGFKKGTTIKRTGDGDQFAILATVMDIIDTFLKERSDVDVLTFVAKREGKALDGPHIKDSRASLYKKMLTKVAKSNNFDIAWEEIARMTEFMLRRKETAQVTEDATSDLRQFANSLKAKYNLKDLWLSDLSSRDAIELSNIIVGKENQKKGIGSKVMTDIINKADADGKIIVLDPALQDKTHGTTSQARLRKFYKRFGFIDNKGGKKNFSFRHIMIRYPVTNKKPMTEAAMLTELFDKKYEWEWRYQDATNGSAIFSTAKGKTVQLDYGPHRDGGTYIVFDTNRAFAKTSNGDQFAIFSTVMDIIKHMLTDYPFPEVTFSADTSEYDGGNASSRANLYRRMIKQFAGPLGYTMDERKGNDEIIFKLTKVDNKLSESAILTELFDKKYKWELQHIDATSSLTTFKTSNTSTVEVLFTLVSDNDEWDVEFHKDGNFEKTSEGDQFAIFSTVMDIIKAFIENKSPYMISFMADKDHSSNRADSRAILYTRMVNKFAGTVGYSARVSKGHSGTGYILTRKAGKLDESFDSPKDIKWTDADTAQATLADDTTLTIQFVQNGPDSFDIDFSRGNSYGVTSQGNQMSVFATVLLAIKDFTRKNNPAKYKFVAEKNAKRGAPRVNSRASLYNKMVSKFASSIGMSSTINDMGYQTEYTLTKVQNEAIFKPHPDDTLGVKRADMPQVHKDHYPEFIKYLEDMGGVFTHHTVDAKKLKPVQSEFSDEGVAKMMSKGSKNGTTRKKPLIVSGDWYIIDGHHRWLASYNLDEEVPIMQVNIPVKLLLKLVADFKHTTSRDIYNEARFTPLEQAYIDGGHEWPDPGK